MIADRLLRPARVIVATSSSKAGMKSDFSGAIARSPNDVAHGRQ
jgi:hypothetical protein